MTAAVAALTGCGGGRTDDGTTAGDRPPALGCEAHDELRQADRHDDTEVEASGGRNGEVASGDLVEVTLRRGVDGVLCLTIRTAGVVRPGSTLALATRQATGAGRVDEQRYEIQLSTTGEVNISRPHGEPRYPVRAVVRRLGSELRVAMQTLLRAGEGFGWRLELQYLPRFPLGDVYTDSIPDRAGWLQLPGAL